MKLVFFVEVLVVKRLEKDGNKESEDGEGFMSLPERDFHGIDCFPSRRSSLRYQNSGEGS